ncbi:MAG: sugar phosphate isomerase/epimerase [Clostridia bacterium]|nr:sugar phosphate isomerase/epimerase [Clostridia bacterium]
MFKIGVQTGALREIFGIEKTYQMVKEAGFDAVDVNLDHLLVGSQIRKGEHVPVFDTQGEEMLAYFKPWKDAAEKYGIDNYQAHAPFPSCIPEPSNGYNDYMLDVLNKTIEGCAYIGCHRLIIHPFFLGYECQLEPQAEWDLNIHSYSQLIPAAKKHGVTICLENMFSSFRGKRYEACCSDITKACRYIDALNEIAGERVFAFCLDTGHLLLLGKDIKNAMIQLGDRIECFHVHDNNSVEDQHLPPYFGKLDWVRFVEGLKAIGFNKTLSFETYNILTYIDLKLAPTILRYIADCGRCFAQRAGE